MAGERKLEEERPFVQVAPPATQRTIRPSFFGILNYGQSRIFDAESH